MGGFQYLYESLLALAGAFGAGPASLAAQLMVASVLAVAGVYKMRHPRIAAAAAVNFHVIAHPWKGAGFALGLIEATVAVALIAPIPSLALAGSVSAGVLSIAYVVVIVRALRNGRRFPCHCLPGLVGDISVATLWRALAMVLASALGAVGPAVGARVGAAAILPAAGLAVVGVGLPLAIFDAVTAWRSYRKLIAEADWVWVLAAHAGRIASPTSSLRGQEPSP